LLIFICLLPFSSFLQEKTTPKYHSPLGIPLVLAANFGELRPNHFHMGVDFKTNGVEGLPLYAIDEGHISRVKISPYGYGKVVYIDHPNGITSVYAHCSGFIGKLDSLVKSIQEREQNFEVDIYLRPNDLRVKKGENFALAGNTGSSTAPHLHFELRDTKTEDALNPLMYGFTIADHKAPEIKGLKIYALNEKGYQIPGKSKVVNVSKSKSGYRVNGDKVEISSDYCSEHGGVGFSFDVIDYYDGAFNVCGLYGSTLKSSKDTVFCQQIDQVSFDHSRYVNSHKDYHEYSQSKRKFHKSFRSEHNPLSIYPIENLGVIPIKPGDSLSMHYSVFDIKKNRSSLDFTLKVQKGEINRTSAIFSPQKYFLPDSAYSFQNEQVEFRSQKHTFYEPVMKNLSMSGTFSFGDPKQPIQEPVTVKLRLPAKSKERSKSYISVTTAGGKVQSLKSSIGGEWIQAESMYLGTYRIKLDTVAPIISPMNFKGTDIPASKTRISWSVSENQTDLIDYDLYIDGKWVVLEYESKGDYLFYSKPKTLKGTHELVLKAKDSCGNIREWSKKITFL
jgi:hypothetical protein